VERRFRLRRSKDFFRVRRSGNSYAHPFIILITLPNDLKQPRIGVTTSKRIGGAVQRNRAKRILREELRHLLPQIKPGFDIVLIARRPILEAKNELLKKALVELMGRAKIMRNKDEN